MRKINNDGVTLMSLVITIIVLLILASIATYSGVNIVKQSKFTKFTTQLKMMQTQVNELYEKYSENQSIEVNGKKYTGTEIANIGKEISTLSQKNKVFNTSTSGITDSTGYKYYDKEIIKALNIDGLEEEEYFVNVAKRSVISYDGFEYNGKTYYTLEQLPDGLYNVEYSENTGKPTFDVNYECIEGGKYKITISNISYNGNIDKWQIKYQKEGQDYWSTSEDYNFVVNEEGKYTICIENNNITSSEKEIEISKLPDGTEKTNTKIKDNLGNEIVIPAGFKVVNPKDNVTDGIIIEDVSHSATKGSQFVWIPVGEVIKDNQGNKETITLGRYVFSSDGTVDTALSKTDPEEQLKVNSSSSDYFTEGLRDSMTANTHAIDIETFRAKAISNHGYYIGRYEARTNDRREEETDNNSLTQITTKPDEYVYNYVTQSQAAILSREMYNDKNFSSDLINSYAWDTAIVFLQKFDTRTDKRLSYSLEYSLNNDDDGLANKGTNNLKDISKKDIICNVWDMASNCWEWTTETYSNEYSSCTLRGGSYANIYNLYTSCRVGDDTSYTDDFVSFRPLLYM